MNAFADYDDLAHLKTPPHSNEAEQAVIGGLLIGGSFDAIADLIAEADFFRSEHRTAFAAISRLADAGQPHDAVTVCDALSASGDLERAGGFAYLIDIANNTPSAANLRAYASAVRERATLRNLISVGQSIADSGYSPDDRTAAELIDQAQAEIIALGDRGGAEQELHVAESMRAYFDELDRRANCDGLVGLATGFTAIDQRTNGLMGGDLFVVGARPKMGKTTFAMNIAEHVAVVQKKPVLVFSMEMSRMQLIDRSVASVGGIPLSLLRAGKIFNTEHEHKLIPAASRIKNAPLYIDDRPALSIQQMRAASRRQHKKTPLALIIVDYIQLARAKAESRVMEITMVSQGLKALAKELDVPVVALSQLSRKCDEQKRRPVASDLRDSGSIEQDADGIFLLYRDEVYHEETKLKGIAEVIIPALRNGEAGEEYLDADLAMCRFKNKEPGYQPPAPQAEEPRKKGFYS